MERINFSGFWETTLNSSILSNSLIFKKHLFNLTEILIRIAQHTDMEIQKIIWRLSSLTGVKTSFRLDKTTLFRTGTKTGIGVAITRLIHNSRLFVNLFQDSLI